jgi:hypothetical protein
MSRPRFRGFEGRYRYRRNLVRVLRHQTEEHNAESRRHGSAVGQFSEVFIKREKGSAGGNRNREDFLIGGARLNLSNPQDVKPAPRSASTAGRGNSRRPKRSCRLQREHFFTVQDLTCVSQTGANVVGLEGRVAVEKLLRGPACCQKIDDQLYRDPRSLNDRLSGQYARVHSNAVTPIHALL